MSNEEEPNKMGFENPILRKRKNPSFVWSHFFMNTDQTKYCKYCQVKYAKSTSNSSLIHHLKTKHDISDSQNSQNSIKGDLSKSKKKKKRSFIWDHFEKNPNTGLRFCNECNKKYSAGTSNTSLIRHLKMTHNITDPSLSITEEESASNNQQQVNNNSN